MVDECNREDTGVGLSIAIGSHQLNKINEDLPKIENEIKIKIKILKFKIFKMFKIKININISLVRL